MSTLAQAQLAGFSPPANVAFALFCLHHQDTVILNSKYVTIPLKKSFALSWTCLQTTLQTYTGPDNSLQVPIKQSASLCLSTHRVTVPAAQVQSVQSARG